MNDRIKRRRTAFFCLIASTTMTLAAFVVLAALSLINFGYAAIAFIVAVLQFVALSFTLSSLTNLYPLNKVDGGTFVGIRSKYLVGRTIALDIYCDEHGIWRLDDKFYFDLKGYIFPKIYICSYFIRNLHYPVINGNNMRLSKLFKSQKTKNIDSLKITFHCGGRAKQCFVVRGGRTKTFPLRGELIRSAFMYDVFGRYDMQLVRHTRIDEDIYNHIKSR